MKTFRLALGFAIELVASEPMLDNPVAMKWDGNGRLWVVQMTDYMPDVYGKGEDAKTGKITVMEDTTGDGRMDKETTFLEGLHLPRTLAHVEGGVLVSEPPTLWYCQDTDGDFVCDQKKQVGLYAKADDPEHCENGLTYALDNWMYSAHSRQRHRFVDGQLIAEPALYRGQWGIAQDNYGRLYYSVNPRYNLPDWGIYGANLEVSITRPEDAFEINPIASISASAVATEKVNCARTVASAR